MLSVRRIPITNVRDTKIVGDGVLDVPWIINQREIRHAVRRGRRTLHHNPIIAARASPCPTDFIRYPINFQQVIYSPTSSPKIVATANISAGISIPKCSAVAMFIDISLVSCH